jgi:hypothetical protein
MTRAAQELYDFLVADLEATEDTDFATALLEDAKAKILAGKGALLAVNSGSQNGKSYTGVTVCTNLDVARAARAALTFWDGDEGSEPTGITFPDFSTMSGGRNGF